MSTCQLPRTIHVQSDAPGGLRTARRVPRWFVLAVLLWGSSASLVHAGNNVWTSLGPSGGTVNDLAIDPLTPTTLYAGTDSGVFKSTDGARTWQAMNTGLSLLSVTALVIDPLTPTTLYAGTTDPGVPGGGGVFKSTDGAHTWQAMNTGLRTNLGFVRFLAIDPLTPTTLYAGTDSGVFKSTDGARTWVPIEPPNLGQLSFGVAALAIDPLTPTTLYAGTNGGGVFKSTDGASTWQAMNTGLGTLSIAALAIDPLTSTTLYVGTSSGVFESTDGASTWVQIEPIGAAALAIDPLTPTTLYAGANGAVFKSTDSGSTWQAMNTGLNSNLGTPSIAILAIDPLTPTILYAVSTRLLIGHNLVSSVFKSTDGARTWVWMQIPSFLAQ